MPSTLPKILLHLILLSSLFSENLPLHLLMYTKGRKWMKKTMQLTISQWF